MKNLNYKRRHKHGNGPIRLVRIKSRNIVSPEVVEEDTICSKYRPPIDSILSR